MISWQTVAERGAMLFTSSERVPFGTTVTVSGSASFTNAEGGSGGTYYSANQTGTTWKTEQTTSASFSNKSNATASGNSFSASGSFSSSFSSAETLTNQTTTTATATYSAGGLATTTAQSTAYTTVTIQANAEEQPWTTAVTLIATTSERETAYTSETTVATVTQGATAIGNCFDTIVSADGNEWLWALTQTFAAWSWGGQLSQAAPFVTIGNIVTLSADVKTEEVSVRPLSVEVQTITMPAQTQSFAYQTYQVVSEVTSGPNFSIFPPKTTNSYLIECETVESETEATVLSEAQVFHFGNTKVFTTATFKNTTATAISPDGKTFVYALGELFAGPNLPPQRFTTYQRTTTVADFGTIQNQYAGGTTTYINTEQQLGLKSYASEEGIFALGASVLKPFGVVYEGSSGEMFSAPANASTTFASNEYVKLNRAVSGNLFGEFAIDLRKNIFSLNTTENEQFTLSGNSLSYQTTENDQPAVSSCELSVVGDLRLGIVDIKSVLGGTPEESATFYQFVPRGVYANQNNATESYSGNALSLADGDGIATYALRPVVHLDIGNNTAKWITVERNPLLAFGPYAQTGLAEGIALDGDYA